MSNLFHHLLAAAWSFALVAGLFTLVAKLWLGRRLAKVTHPAQFDSPGVFIALVLPGLLPLVWLASGLLHLEESGALTEACCSMLALSHASWQEWVFGAGATALVGVQMTSLWRRWSPSHGAHATTSIPAAQARVRQICLGHPKLAELADRVRVVDCGAHVCAAVGLTDQRIEIAASLVERLDDDALEAALLHELAHVSVWDPARNFALLLSQVINPFSWLLARESSAWRFAREVVCDSYAVEMGAEPVSVADALLTAAKAVSNTTQGACRQVAGAFLCGSAVDALTARVNLLLNTRSDEHVFHDSRKKVPAIGSAFLAMGLILPHVLGAQVISFHCLLEETLNTLTFLF